jgi:hypothetical protein
LVTLWPWVSHPGDEFGIGEDGGAALAELIPPREAATVAMTASDTPRICLRIRDLQN